MTLQQAVDDFLLEQRVRGNTDKTLDYYVGSLKKFAVFFGTDIALDRISHAILRQYTVSLQDSGLASTSIQTYIRALRAFLTFCYTEEYLSENLSERFRLPKSKRPQIDILTDEECNRLLMHFNLKYFAQLRDYCMCALMLDCGLRINEVVTLRIEYLHLQDGYLLVDGKGNKQRSVPIGYCTRRTLARYLRRRPAMSDVTYVFVTARGLPVHQSTLKQLFRKLKDRCAIPR
ncbi:MAG: tyrosine-type recombinase/integrase, partial [Oscillospiraceae bacterium]